MTQSVIASSASIIYRLALQHDLDPAQLFEKAGLNISLIKDPNSRIDSAAIDRAWKRLGDAIDSPCFGLEAAEHWHPSDLQALGYAWLSSHSLRSALERLCRYARVVTEVDEFTLKESNGTVSIILSSSGLSANDNWVADSILAVLVSMCRANAGEDFTPESIEFVHPEPTCVAEFFKFFRCPVQFDAESNRIIFSAQSLDNPLTSANPYLAQIHDQIMIEYLAHLDKNDVIQLVRSAIVEQLPSGDVTDARIAAALNRTERTLQRQLRNKGTTFKTLLNEIRIDLARKYIHNSRLSLTEISFLLGFSEISAFSRAFRRWTGKSPSQYRQSLSVYTP